jgi:hypothetical protein
MAFLLRLVLSSLLVGRSHCLSRQIYLWGKRKQKVNFLGNLPRESCKTTGLPYSSGDDICRLLGHLIYQFLTYFPGNIQQIRS